MIKKKFCATSSNKGGLFIISFALLSLLFILSSCATKAKIGYRDRIVDHYNTVTVHDTLIDKTTDSTYVYVTTKGDTVYQNVYRERTRWRDRIVERHDTCWRDSIVTEYKENVKEVVKVPKFYRYTLAFSLICIIFAAIKIYKFLTR